MNKFPSQEEINKQKFLQELKVKQLLPKINEIYPDVLLCTITYTRKAEGLSSWIEDKQPKTMYCRPFDSSFITVPCNNIDCTKGHFDLHSIIGDMIQQHETHRQGKLICDGYQDAERIGIHLCDAELSFIIQIDYKNHED